MKNKIKTFAAIAALGVATIGISSIGLGDNNATTPPTPVAASTTPTHTKHFSHCRYFHHRHHGIWNLGLYRNKHLTESDARIITQAALLMEGKHNQQVGEIQTKVSRRGNTFYLISIVNKENKVVRQVVLNSRSGRIHPMHVRHVK